MKGFQNTSFLLMNKDVPVMQFNIEYDDYDTFVFEEKERLSSKLIPYGFSNITQWLSDRQAPKHRAHIKQLLEECGCDDLDGYIRITHALTLNDTYWIKELNSNLQWKNVSLYTNDFDEVIARIAFEGGMYGEQFSTTSPEFGTDGSYSKCWIRSNDNVYLLKAGSTGGCNTGREPYSEMYASQLARLICHDSVDYTLEKYRGQLVSKCKLFTSEKEGFVKAGKLLPEHFNIEQMVNLYAKYGCEDNFKRMVVFDALVVNVDRHTGNHGFIFNNDSNDIIRMAPIFDNNLSLLPSAQPEDFIDGYKYLSNQKPKIGREFCEIAHKFLTESIKSDLLNLRTFKFEKGSYVNLPDERLDQLNDLLQLQINGVLDSRNYYMSVIKPNVVSQPKIKANDFFLKK